MTRRILLIPTNYGAGLTAAALGLAHAMDERRINAGYIKPLAQARHDGGDDVSGDLIRMATPLRPMPPIPAATLEHMLAAGWLDGLMEDVLQRAEETVSNHDIVLIEGLMPSADQMYSDRVNVAMAKAFDADVLLVGSAAEHPPERLADQMAAIATLYRIRERSRIAGAVINRIPSQDQIASYRRAVEARRIPVAATVVAHDDLTQLRVRDVARQLGLSIIHAGDLDRRIGDVQIAAQSVPGFVSSMINDRLIIVPGDRHDVMMSAGLAEISGTKLAALLLTAGVRPDPEILALCKPAMDAGLPILLTPEKTYPTAQAIIGLDPEIPADDTERARRVMNVVADGFDETWMDTLPRETRRSRFTAAQFRVRAFAGAKRDPRRIVLPEGSDPKIIAAAVEAHQRGLVEPVILGIPTDIQIATIQAGVNVPTGMKIINPQRPDDKLVMELMNKRGIGVEEARLAMRDPLLTGTLMVSTGFADGMVVGRIFDRSQLLPLAKEFIGQRPDVCVISSAHVMLLPDQVVVYTDCAINAEPDAEQLACIAKQAAELADSVGIEPRIAMISASMSMPDEPAGRDDREKVAEATRMLRERRPDFAIDGPMTYAAAAAPSIAAMRSPDSPVAGRATVYVFPDLRTGRTTYHAVRRSAGVVSVGPLLLGLNRPVNSVPADAGVEVLVGAIVGTALQASVNAVV